MRSLLQQGFDVEPTKKDRKMSTDFNATIEIDDRADTFLPVDVDRLVDALEAYHVAVGASPRGWLEVIITLPADSLLQASITALTVVRDAVRKISNRREPIACEVMTTEEFDARHDMQPLPSMIGTTEAAEILGVSPQRVVQLVNAGQLSAAKAGRSLALARMEVEKFKERERPTGRPRTRTHV